MNTHHSNPRLRRGFTFVALAATLGITAISLTQCRMIDDSVTGVDLKTNGSFGSVSQCVQKCNDAYKSCRDREDGRHRNALLKINSIQTSTDREAAKKIENNKHQEATNACEDAMQRCKRDCKYREGSGSGGR
jgi:hypothetical protein